MKNILIKFSILSFVLFANANAIAHEKSTLSYQGQTFSGEYAQQNCLNHKEIVINKMRDIGYIVYEGQCSHGVFSNTYSIVVRYEYEVLNYIDNIKISFTEERQCASAQEQTEQRFNSTNTFLIVSYCQKEAGKHLLMIDYKTSGVGLRNYTSSNIYFSNADCLAARTSFEEQILSINFRPVLSSCLSKSDETHYFFILFSAPLTHYLYTLDTEAVGTSRERCEIYDEEVVQRFAEADLQVLMFTCAFKNQQFYKRIVYKASEFSELKIYQGFSQSSLLACQLSLEEILENFAAANRKVVYSYCQANDDKTFFPKLYFK